MGMKLTFLVILGFVALIMVSAGIWLYTPDKPRAALEAKYGVAAEDVRLVAGIRLHVKDTGPKDAPAIILLHGFGSSLETWEPWATRLSLDHWVIRYDLPGFALTGPDPTADYSDARSMSVLAALMDGFGITKATLVGNSLGGKLAWMFAADHPERVDKLVLISPDGFASPGFEYGKRPDIPFMVRLLPYVLPRMLLRISLAPAYGDQANLTEPAIDRYRDMMLAPGVRDAMVKRMGQVMLEDPVPLLRRIQAPTLLLWGECDAMIPFTNAGDYASNIPHATLAPLSGLGHVPFEEAPERSLQPVLKFLSR